MIFREKKHARSAGDGLSGVDLAQNQAAQIFGWMKAGRPTSLSRRGEGKTLTGGPMPSVAKASFPGNMPSDQDPTLEDARAGDDPKMRRCPHRPSQRACGVTFQHLGNLEW